MEKLQQSKRDVFIFIGPAIAVMMAVTVIPFIYGIWLSFHNLPRAGRGEPEAVGFSNYLNLLNRVEFWDALKVTSLYVGLVVFLSVFLGFFLALLLNRDFYGKSILLGLFILPIVTTPVVSGLMWKFLFSADLGLINYALSLLRIPPVTWLSNPLAALSAIVIVDLWHWIPFCMFLILAGLQNLPVSTFEAALIEGANKFQMFWKVIFPQMIPITSIVFLFRIMDSFKAFDTIFILTQGGPGRATQTLNLLSYYIGFRYFDMGIAAALGIFVLILVFVVAKSTLALFAHLEK